MRVRTPPGRFRRLGIVAVLVSTVIGLAACSSSGSGNGNGTTSGKHTSSKFTYWSMYKVGEPAQKVLAAAVSDFEKQTGITVDVQWQGRTNLQKLVPALNTHNVPDLVDGSYLKLYPALVATKQALGLDAAYSAKVDGSTPVDQLVPAKYLKGIDIAYDNGQKWMLPVSLTSDGIWYDADKNPELRSNPPKTWDDFMTLLNKLKADGGPAPVAIDGDIPGYNAYWFDTLLIRNLGPGSLMHLVSDKTGAAWDDPAVLDAAKKVEQLVKGGYVIKGYNASKWPAQQQAWADHKASLLFMGSWAATETAPYAAKGFNYASFPFPLTAAGKQSARADFIGFAVPKKAEHADAAQKFAAFMLSKKYQQMLATDAKLLPIRSDIEVSPELADVKKTLDAAPEFYQQNDGVAFPGYNDKVFWPVDDKLVLGKISAEQFVSSMKKATVDYWKNQS